MKYVKVDQDIQIKMTINFRTWNTNMVIWAIGSNTEIIPPPFTDLGEGAVILMKETQIIEGKTRWDEDTNGAN